MASQSQCRQNLEFVAPFRNLKSPVWQYFGFYRLQGSDETHFDRTMCTLCNNLLAYNRGCTQNMRYHLIRFHKINPNSIPNNVSLEISDGQLTERTTPSCLLDKVDTGQFEIVSASSSLKSLVWQYFGYYKLKDSDDVKHDRTWCKLCDSFIPHPDSSLSRMHSHLSRHHNIYLKAATVAQQSPESSQSSESDTSDSLNDMTTPQDVVFVKAEPSLKGLVWNYFGFYRIKGTEINRYDRTCCKLCNNLVKYSTSNTSRMRNHLERVHYLNLDELSKPEQDSSAAKTSSQSCMTQFNGPSYSETPSQSWAQLKKVLKKQCCSNANCNTPIQLESDGSPPQFCGCCGLLLSVALSVLWSRCGSCCQLCGKLKSSSPETNFCSRCGSFLTGDVEMEEVEDSKEEDLDYSSPKNAEKTDVKAVEFNGDILETPFSSNTTDQSEHRIDFDIQMETAGNIERSSELATWRECEFCDYKTSSMRQFTQHLKSHLDPSAMAALRCIDEVDELTLESADDQTGRLHNLIENIKELKHRKLDIDWQTEMIDSTSELIPGKLECNRCNFECDQQDELDAHVMSHSKTVKQIIRYCRKCNDEFRTLSQLRQHEKVANCEEKVLACDECDYMTTKVDSFRGHKRRNHGEIELKACKYCDRKFKRQRNLEEHMNTHTGCTPFQCDKCGKAFHTNSSWYKHKRNNCEPGLRERKLCSHCGREVINLSKHISDVHFNIKEFTCETCSKSFGTQYHLDRHIRIHTGEKPFACKYCDYRASQKVVTDGHMKKCRFRLQATHVSNSDNPS